MGVAGCVRLTTTDAVWRWLVLPSFRALLKNQPLLQLDLHTGNDVASLSRRDTDLALRVTRKPLDHLIGRKIGVMRFAPCTVKTPHQKKPVASNWTATDWIAPDDALLEHPSVLWRRKNHGKVDDHLAKTLRLA